MNDNNTNVQIWNMTITELKNELKLLKLKAINVKAELVRRLQAGRFWPEDQKDEDTSDGYNGNYESESEGEDRHRRISSRKNFLTFTDIEHCIDTFSGDDGMNVMWWIEDFEDMATLCGWNDEYKTIYAKKLLRGSAQSFVKYEMRGKLWKNIKSALKEEFFHNVDTYIVQQELQRRKKRSNETYNEYCYKMLEIASRMTMDISTVIQYIIDGIVDEEVNKSILYGAKSIPELKNKFVLYERMKNKCKFPDYLSEQKNSLWDMMGM